MRALVTGGSRGIGRSICLRLAEDALARGETARVVVSATGRSPDLAAIVAELKVMGAEALAVTGDLGDTDTPGRIVQEAAEFAGGLDVLVHNAGGAIAGSLLKTSIEDWDTVMSVNLRALFLLGKAAHPYLREARGAICAIGSQSAERVLPFVNAYTVSKAALVMLVQQMSYEWGRHGIRVNAVSPGLVISRSTEEALAGEDVQARTAAHIPLGRLATPEDVANVVAFVVGPQAGYLSGENINVDGALRHANLEQMMAHGNEGKWSAQGGANLG